MTPGSEHSHDAQLFFELGSMRHVARTWRQFGGIPFANNAEHSFRVAWIAWLLAEREGADSGKVVQMALMHDIGEIRSVDVNYLSRQYTARDESRAISDTVSLTSLEESVTALWSEMESRSTLEAKIVKDADALDCDFELHETAATGYRLSDVLHETRIAARERLYTAAARELWDALYASDPHAWHTQGPNRLTTGDWRARQ